ncbi:MAG: hypothetical protein JWM40_1173 [Frankiales bacterium]|nr:hypothetical protein [Frankiales bacterium]
MELDTLLHETADVAGPSAAALANGRAAMDDAVVAGRRRVLAIGRGHSRRTRRLAVAVAAAAAAVLVVPTIDLGGGRPHASADAAQVLLRAGTAAGAQPGQWQDAAYWHSVSTYHQGASPTQRREIWIGHRAIGVLKDGGVGSGYIPLEVASFSAGARGISWDELYALPTEAGALERSLRDGIDGAGPDDDSELFVIVGDLLRESPAPPALRKALWEVAARVPGVKLVGVVADSVGRAGVAVERHDSRYVLDPSNGRLLEESSSDWTGTYLEQGPVDTAPAPTNAGAKG